MVHIFGAQVRRSYPPWRAGSSKHPLGAESDFVLRMMRRVTAALLLGVVLFSSLPWEVAAAGLGDGGLVGTAVLSPSDRDATPGDLPLGDACLCLCTLCPSSTVGRPAPVTERVAWPVEPSAAVTDAGADPHAAPDPGRLLRPPRAA